MKSMLKDAGILFAITLVAGLLLGCVYQITKEPIARQEALAQENACREVFSDAESFEAVTDFTEEAAQTVLNEGGQCQCLSGGKGCVWNSTWLCADGDNP